MSGLFDRLRFGQRPRRQAPKSVGARQRFSRNLSFIAFVCVLVSISVVGRMYELTVIEGPSRLEKSTNVKCRDRIEMAYRGGIVDRTGVALATSTPAKWVAREKGYVYSPEHAPSLAKLISREADDLDKALSRGNDGFIWLARGIGFDEATAIKQLKIRGIGLHSRQRRTYPQGNVAAHLIGFVNIDAVGIEGIEKSFDEVIRGKPVTVHACQDVHGRVFLRDGDLAGVNSGATVHLTIDATLQSIAEAELVAQVEATGAVGGTVVMLDPRTGDILAMANAPSYDPNEVAKSTGDQRRNRSVTDLFEPGSTLKPFVIAGALEEGVIAEDQRFFCENGAWQIEGRRKPVSDHHPYGWLDTTGVLRVSSNICTAKMGFVLGARKVYDYLYDFGFDRVSDTGLPYESRGLVPKPPEEWRPNRLATISFGQGLAVNALQLASAFATLANDGKRMKPRLVSKVVDPWGGVLELNEPEVERVVLKPGVAQSINRMLETVVSDTGTARLAAIDGVRVAGKTGTAQKAENGGYSKTRWLASFAGFLPVDDPRLVIVVLIDEPKGVHYGGVIAGPVFQRVAEASLDVLGIERALPPPTSEDLDLLFVRDDADYELEDGEAVGDGSAASDEPGPGEMPDLVGLSLREASRTLAELRCTMDVEGEGYVVVQTPPAGEALANDRSVALVLGRSL
jgi:cell division protein FtsI (penicillin-binding protein 3)